MLIETLSTFPHMYDSVMGESMMKRAQEKGILEFRAHDLRDWTHDRHRTTDDDPYGGGAGLVMKCEPIFEAVEAILGKGFVEAKLAAIMGERGEDVGCPDRASSAATGTAQWAVPPSEPLLEHVPPRRSPARQTLRFPYRYGGDVAQMRRKGTLWPRLPPFRPSWPNWRCQLGSKGLYFQPFVQPRPRH